MVLFDSAHTECKKRGCWAGFACVSGSGPQGELRPRGKNSPRMERRDVYVGHMRGKASLAFERPPVIISSGSVAGTKEGRGPLGAFFDQVE